MRTTLKLFLLLLLLAPLAHAQGPIVAGMAPVMEAGFGYSYVDAKVPSQGTMGMNGVQGIFNADFNRHWGVKVDVGYSRVFDAFHSGRTADMLTYMGGPVLYPLRGRSYNVYAHALLGGARETGVNYTPTGQVALGFVNQFAWAAGAGFQRRLTTSWSIRLGADYLHTKFFDQNLTVQGQSNLRGSVSLIYTFGERE
ncbi:MAG TPA: outer membrane beta-barrel protein [Methylomirabilota bacterium]|nr:outer membrane beta-barrel protein [Methylomirabilota bacterium]